MTTVVTREQIMADAARALKHITSASHPASELFPMLDGDEFEALKADIREHGQREPIVLVAGEIVDGRNRMRACEELGIEPVTRNLSVKEAGDVFALVMSLNYHRRHLKPHQSGKVIAAYMEHVGAKKRGPGRPKKSQAPCDSPSQTLTAIAEQFGISQQVASNHLKAHEDYEAAAPEFKAKVDEGKMTPRDAAKKTAKQSGAPKEERADGLTASPSFQLINKFDGFRDWLRKFLEANPRQRVRAQALVKTLATMVTNDDEA